LGGKSLLWNYDKRKVGTPMQLKGKIHDRVKRRCNGKKDFKTSRERIERNTNLVRTKAVVFEL